MRRYQPLILGLNKAGKCCGRKLSPAFFGFASLAHLRYMKGSERAALQADHTIEIDSGFEAMLFWSRQTLSSKPEVQPTFKLSIPQLARKRTAAQVAHRSAVGRTIG